MAHNQTQGTALNQEMGLQAINAVRRLQQISKTVILTPNLEAEKTGLQNFLHSTLINHADELLACWSAIRFEYEPLVGSVSLVIDRILSIRRSRILANEVPAQPPENPTAPLTPDNGDTPDSGGRSESNIIHIAR